MTTFSLLFSSCFFFNLVSVPNLLLFFYVKSASLIWFLCQICFFNFLCQFLFFNLVSVPNLLLYFPFSVSNLLLEFGFCAKFLWIKSILTFLFSYFGHLPKIFAWCWTAEDVFSFEKEPWQRLIQISIPKVNSSKFNSKSQFFKNFNSKIGKDKDCQSHQAKIGSFASNSTPEV